MTPDAAGRTGGSRGRIDDTFARLFSRVGVDMSLTRALALGGLVLVLVSVLSVLHYIVLVSQEPDTFFLLVAASLVAATVTARFLRVTVALSIAGVAFAVGLFFYLGALSSDPQVGALLASNAELLSGKSILEIEAATLWALSVTPAPVFVLWYLGLRGWYGTATLVGAGLLAYFVLTGDAGLPLTLLGVVGGAAAVGFGDLDRREHSQGALEAVAVVLAVMVVTPLVVSVVPGSIGLPFGFGGADQSTGDTTLEASLLSSDSEFELQGSIELSPKVRYTVTSTEPRYWRVDSYNRYTGDGWVRSGESVPESEMGLPNPPGPTREVRQTFQVESATAVMPAAWRPVAVSGAGDPQVSTEFGLAPSGTLSDGSSYQVTSAVPEASPRDLATAGSRDPQRVTERYTQVPASTPDRVAARAESITDPAENRYEAASRVEQWLESNKEYSLAVDRPEGDVADAFIFEMDRGYCTYYATAMAVMLRTQDVPARVTVGYTTGEQVDDDRYVVRGYDSHAWVEVYFPDVGWMRFDPTPASPRQTAQQARLDEARATGEPGVDTDETDPAQQTPTPTETTATPGEPTTVPPSGPTQTTTDPYENVSEPTSLPEDDDGGSPLPDLPPPDQLALAAILFVGTVAGLRRSGVSERVYRWAWLRYQPQTPPPTDVERTFRRLMYVLQRRSRPRRSGETVRAYLAAIDAGEEARELAAIREQSRYGDGIGQEQAARARELLRRVRSREAV